MKAAVCIRYGATEQVVEIRDMPKPEVGANDVLIEVYFASINPIDSKIQQGGLKAIRKMAFPFVMGFDASGVVVEIGSAVTRFKVGDEVFTRVDSKRFGTFAELVAVDEKLVARKPENVTHAEAASVPLVALTIWQSLFDKAGLKAGQKLLVHAGSGGIGTVAIQIAKYFGLKVATTTSTKNVALVKDLGADVVVDYKVQNFEDVLKDYDMVLDTIGGDNVAKSFQVLKKEGLLVSIVGIPTGQWARTVGLPFFLPWMFDFLNRKIYRLAKAMNVRYDVVIMTPNGEQLAQIGKLLEDGNLKPVLDREFSLDDIKEALLYSQSGRARGKITVKIK